MKHPTTRYSELKYEKTPYRLNGKPRVWVLERQPGTDIGSDLLKLWGRFLLLRGKKELFMALILIAAFVRSGPVYAYEPPTIKEVPTTIERIQPLKPVAVLKAKIPAKKHKKAIPKPKPVVSAPRASRASGSCADWMRAAGVPITAATNKLIINESGCNPTAQNPTSSAYGIGQFLDSTWGLPGVDCVKSSDPVYQIRCMDKYVKVVYTTWENALAKWYSRCAVHCWY